MPAPPSWIAGEEMDVCVREGEWSSRSSETRKEETSVNKEQEETNDE